jgi:hypothetical protein
LYTALFPVRYGLDSEKEKGNWYTRLFPVRYELNSKRIGNWYTALFPVRYVLDSEKKQGIGTLHCFL